jgi:hypothetical protein
MQSSAQVAEHHSPQVPHEDRNHESREILKNEIYAGVRRSDKRAIRISEETSRFLLLSYTLETSYVLISRLQLAKFIQELLIEATHRLWTAAQVEEVKSTKGRSDIYPWEALISEVRYVNLVLRMVSNWPSNRLGCSLRLLISVPRSLTLGPGSFRNSLMTCFSFSTSRL